MANVPLARAVLPVEVSKALLTRAQSTFAADYRDTLLLLIRGELGGDVVAGLDAILGGTAQPAFLPARQLGYETQAYNARTVRALLAARDKPRRDQPALIATALAEGVHFVVSLRKRPNADQILLDRISVGRASNKDIVLRDASVSKLHAWFELHEARDFSVTDAGSKNQTYVNGEALVPRQPFPLAAGDAIRFGSVLGLLCEAEALWSAIQEHHAAS
jgi:hypothetical protein